MYDREEYIKQAVPINFELNLLFKRDKQITIFDIGACEGEDSVRYSRLFPESKIYAFEPLPKNIELIEIMSLNTIFATHLFSKKRFPARTALIFFMSPPVIHKILKWQIGILEINPVHY